MGTSERAAAPRAYGEAKIRLAWDDASDLLSMSCHAAWFTPDGQSQESSMTIDALPEEAFAGLQELQSWLWRRWKRPIAESVPVGPFD